jgi:hypothetical protein
MNTNQTPVTLESWVDTGRFNVLESFKIKFPNAILHDDCSDVVVYRGGLYIQALKDKSFFVAPNANSKVLDDMELHLWEIHKEKLMNNIDINPTSA